VDIDASEPTARNATNTQRANLQYRYTPSRTFKNDLRIGLGRDAGETTAFGRFALGFSFMNVTLRDEAQLTLHPSLALTFGLDARLEVAKYNVHAFRPPKEGQTQDVLPADAESLDVEGQRTDPYVAGFLEAQWTPTEQLTIIPGARVDYFGMGKAATFDPRLMLHYALTPSITLKGGVGVVHQAPELDEAIPPFGNPDIGPARALQASVGAKWQPLDYLSGEVTVFYKHLDHLVRPVDDDDLYRNEGKGRVTGMEVFLRQRLAHGLSGWLSYTLSRSERTDSSGAGRRLFDYDQTHILSRVARYELPANWSVGARWRLVSGRPVTPFVGGVFQEDRDSYEGIQGAPNSDRLPLFHMLDLRVDKRWVYNQWALSTYLSVSNAYNRGNAQDVAYSFNYRQKEVIAGLPILPIFGVTGTF
jgi:outer membrane receptor protein involved in Fe transport